MNIHDKPQQKSLTLRIYNSQFIKPKKIPSSALPETENLHLPWRLQTLCEAFSTVSNFPQPLDPWSSDTGNPTEECKWTSQRSLKWRRQTLRQQQQCATMAQEAFSQHVLGAQGLKRPPVYIITHEWISQRKWHCCIAPKVLLGWSLHWKIKMISWKRNQGTELFHLWYSSLSKLLSLLLWLDEVGVVGQFPHPVFDKLAQASSAGLVLLCEGVGEVPIAANPNENSRAINQLLTQLKRLKGTSDGGQSHDVWIASKPPFESVPITPFTKETM